MLLSPLNPQTSLIIVRSSVLKHKIPQNLANVYSFLKPRSFDILAMKMEIFCSPNLNMTFQFNLTEKKPFVLASHSAKL